MPNEVDYRVVSPEIILFRRIQDIGKTHAYVDEEHRVNIEQIVQLSQVTLMVNGRASGVHLQSTKNGFTETYAGE